MKLNQFLSEDSQIESEYLNKFGEETAHALKELEQKLNKLGLKIEKYKSGYEDDDFGILFSNKIFDFWITVDIVSSGNKKHYNLAFRLGSNAAYSINARSVEIAAEETTVIPFTDYDLAKWIRNTMDFVIAPIDDLVEWYFDVSGEYGKVKLFVDRGVLDSVEVVAMAGKFNIEKKEGKVF